jgi:quinoprotein glucose dehydrogenase
MRIGDFRLRQVFRLQHLVSAAILLGVAAPAQVVNEEWPAYGRDSGGSRYSPLGQITRENVTQLKMAWTYRTGELGLKSRSGDKLTFETTPIVSNGTLYLTTGFNRVIALDPATGTERWTFDPKVDRTRDYSEVTSRGVSVWSDPRPAIRCRRRIFVATIDARLIALDANSGTTCPGFGTSGEVDLTRDVRFVDAGSYQVTSPPAVIGDLIIVGSTIGDNRGVELERGVVRAYEARTGKLRWSWDPIPQTESDPAHKTWEGKSSILTGAANAWAPISVDAQRDLVFVPTSSPSPDFFGGERKGDNLYANSIVALRASTGKMVWHFQLVHHDLWDYDVPAQPLLLTIRNVAAVAVATKMGHIFVFERETGKPLFPVEERPVPQTNVPGEVTSKTQPFPTLPAPLVPQRLTAEDAWGLTEPERNYCRDRIKSLRSEGIFTPPSIEGSVMYPSNAGGMNWSGMSFDPVRGLLITNTNRIAFEVRLIPRDEYNQLRGTKDGNRLKGEFAPQTGTPYGMYREPLRAPSGAPCNPPPWGALTAVDINTGTVKWDVPLGSVPQLSLMPNSARWGSPNFGGSIVTAGGLVFIGAGMDQYFRAFDVETGKQLWKGDLPASPQATPMTYQVGGKQFVVIAAGGHGKLGTKRGDYLVAFTLP